VRRPSVGDVLLGALAIVLLGTTIGVVRNELPRPRLLLMAPFRPPLPAGVAVIGTAEAARYLSTGRALFVDAREIERYRAGHIISAVSLPFEEGVVPGAAVATLMRRAPAVIIYCDGPECRASQRLAERLRDLGYGRLRLYEEGYPAWEAGVYPTRSGDAP